ncbi:MAG: caspase family protein [Planctomycetes bacterium]|nr:caspase family protein [Planctomycetota bacterium]
MSPQLAKINRLRIRLQSPPSITLLSLLMLLSANQISFAQDAERCDKPDDKSITVQIHKPKSRAHIKGQEPLEIFLKAIESKLARAIILINDKPSMIITDDKGGGFKFYEEDQSGKNRYINKNLTVLPHAGDFIKLDPGVNEISVHVWDESGACNISTKRVRASRGEIRGVVIGINKYEHIKELRFAESDAVAFKKHLVDNLLVDGKKIVALTASASNDKYIANKRNILKWVDKQGRNLGDSDTLIVFFSGHGWTNPNVPSSTGTYFMPMNYETDSYTTAIKYSELVDLIKGSHAGRKIFVMDACFVGDVPGAKSISRAGSKAVLTDVWGNVKGMFGMLSSEMNQASWEDPLLSHGVFTYYLLEGLKNGDGMLAEPVDKKVTLREAFAYAKEKVIAYTQNHEVFKLQTPRKVLPEDQPQDIEKLVFGFPE